MNACLTVPSGPLRGWPRLGFGVAGVLAGPLSDADLVARLVDIAVKGGAPYFDTAPAYGGGEAERRLGLALKTLRRDQFFLSTKGGILSGRFGRRLRGFTPDGLERELDASLTRLGVDYVDIFFTHGIAFVEMNDAIFRRLDDIKASGRARQIGAAGDREELSRLYQHGAADVVMTPLYPELDPQERARLDGLRKNGVGVIGIEVMSRAQPSLAGGFSAGGAYRLARRFVRGPPPKRGAFSRTGALQAFYRDDLGDIALVSTTKPERLAENLTIAAGKPA